MLPLIHARPARARSRFHSRVVLVMVRVGILLGVLLQVTTAHAQLEVVPLTNTKSNAVPSAPRELPEANVPDNSALIENNFNLVPISITRGSKSSAESIAALRILLDKKQREIDSLDVIRVQLAKVPADKKKLAELQKIITLLVVVRDALKREIDQQQKTEDTKNRSRMEVQQEVRRELFGPYNKQLTSLRENVAANAVLQAATLTTYRDQLTKLRADQRGYWDDSATLNSPQTERNFNKTRAAFERQLSAIETHITTATVSYRAFENAHSTLTAYAFTTDSLSPESRKRYDTLTMRIQRLTTDLNRKIDSVKVNLNRYNAQVNAWNKSYREQQESEKASDDNLTALPTLAGIKGSGKYIPSVALLGSHRGGSVNSPTYYLVKVFTALAGTGDASDLGDKRGTERLFIPEASTFGFSSDVLFTLNYANRKSPVLGVALGVGYLDKRMAPDTTITFTTGVFTSRLGLEVYAIPNVLLFYSNINSLSFITGREAITRHFTVDRPRDVYFFPNGGMRAILKASDKSGLSFLFDLGMVYQNRQIKEFVATKDFGIVTMRATVAKNFMLR